MGSMEKMIAITALGPLLWHVLNKYVWNDWEFVGFLAVLIVLDTVLGFVVAWKRREISSAKMARLPLKIFVYACSLVAIHALSNYTIKGSPSGVLAMLVPYIDSVMYSYIVLREVLSIYEKTAKLGYAFLPRWVAVRIKMFQRTGKVTDEEPPRKG